MYALPGLPGPNLFSAHLVSFTGAHGGILRCFPTSERMPSVSPPPLKQWLLCLPRHQVWHGETLMDSYPRGRSSSASCFPVLAKLTQDSKAHGQSRVWGRALSPSSELRQGSPLFSAFPGSLFSPDILPGLSFFRPAFFSILGLIFQALCSEAPRFFFHV